MFSSEEAAMVALVPLDTVFGQNTLERIRHLAAEERSIVDGQLLVRQSGGIGYVAEVTAGIRIQVVIARE